MAAATLTEKGQVVIERLRRGRADQEDSTRKSMIAVDENILARFYCDDPDDPEADKQRPRARRVMTESPAAAIACEPATA